MPKKKCFLLALLCFCATMLAQCDTIALKEVIIADSKLRQFSSSQTILTLNDSILSKNGTLLTNSLNFNTVLYFKEYGRGMLSTVSFRGTTSSQTAVMWNGININSQMTGSTDFNTISAMNYQSVDIKGGGGSVIYGSGAIGGTVHLNNELRFDNSFTNQLRIDYGTFDTQSLAYKGHFSNAKWSTQVGFSRDYSKNDYKYLDTYDWKGNQLYNQNGEYHVFAINAALGFKISEKQLLKGYSQSSNSDRNLSLLSPSESKTKFKNDFTRNLLEYNGVFNQCVTNFKMAYVTEEYQYFPNNEKLDQYNFGKTNSWINKVDLSVKATPSLLLNTIFEYNKTRGEGSGFGNHQREISSIAVLIKQDVTSDWQNELAIRKEYTNNYKSPVLFSLGSSIDYTNWYQLKLNVSHNFRIPTYNDLYWEPGGNPNLKPESAHQGELANVFKFKNFSFTQTAYYNKIKDMLRWVPGRDGIWSPQNTDRVVSYGLETLFSGKMHFGSSILQCNATYAYTVSKDKETTKQLFYVPYHKLTAGLAYNRNKFSAHCQFLYNGMVFTSSDNFYFLDDFDIWNIGFDLQLGKKGFGQFGFGILNLFNKYYESVSNRPMPGRNFTINFNFNL